MSLLFARTIKGTIEFDQSKHLARDMPYPQPILRVSAIDSKQNGIHIYIP